MAINAGSIAAVCVLLLATCHVQGASIQERDGNAIKGYATESANDTRQEVDADSGTTLSPSDNMDTGCEISSSSEMDPDAMMATTDAMMATTTEKGKCRRCCETKLPGICPDNCCHVEGVFFEIPVQVLKTIAG